jgi:hypothetical protein
MGLVVAETSQKVTVVEKQVKQVVNEVKTHDQRITALEEARASVAAQHVPVPARPSLDDALAAEFSNIRSLLNDARALSRVAVVGCHGRKEPNRQGILNLIRNEASLAEVRFDIRGLVARITFDYNGEEDGPVRAQRFVENVNNRQSASTFWAKVDEPRTLRDLKARARSFGAAVIDLCSCFVGEVPRTSIVNGFLIVGDVVVAPITMIPGEHNRDEACNRVRQILLDPNHTPVNYKEALEHQLRRSITSHLYDLLHKPRFVDSIPPPPPKPSSKPVSRQFVTPAAFEEALKLAVANQEKAVNTQDSQPPVADSMNIEAGQDSDEKQEEESESDSSKSGSESAKSKPSSQLSSDSSEAESSEVVPPTQPPPKRKVAAKTKKKPRKAQAPKKSTSKPKMTTAAASASARGRKRPKEDSGDETSASDLPQMPSLLSDSVIKRVRRSKAGNVPIT